MNSNRQMVGVFDTLNDAERARDAVRDAGVGMSDVRVISPDDISDKSAAEQDAPDASMMDQVSDFFTSIFGADDEEKVSERYLQAVRSGSSLVVVDSDDSSLDRSRIEQILQAGTSAEETSTAGSASPEVTGSTAAGPSTQHTEGTADAGTRHSPTDDPTDRDTINAGTDDATGPRNRNEMV